MDPYSVLGWTLLILGVVSFGIAFVRTYLRMVEEEKKGTER